MMGEMFSYIFNNMKSTDKILDGIQKVLIAQKAFNRNMTLYAVIMTAYILANESRRYKQEKKIAKLSKEIEELKGE